MAVRRPHLVAAGVDLAFLMVALGLGALAAPIWAMALSMALHGLVWWLQRRAVLARLDDPAPVVIGALSLLVATQAGAYGLALFLFAAIR